MKKDIIQKIVVRGKLLLFMFLVSNYLHCQHVKRNDLSMQDNSVKKFNYSSLIIPTSLITFGFVGLESGAIKRLNNQVQKSIKHRIPVDDYSQYAPFLSVYGLNAIGVDGMHNFKNRTIILGTAYLTMCLCVNGLKYTIDADRPDGSSNNTFPSGHTATTFMGAEFLYQEYKEKSVWIGVAGYLVAGFTGCCRMANNKHWFNDVIGGAGIGILSTKIAYWLYPILKRTIFKDKKDLNGMIAPFYNGEGYGMSLTLVF